MNKRIFGITLGILSLILAITPVMAFGPENAENNPWLISTNGGTNVQLLLPSGVKNEWKEIPAINLRLRVVLKDAAIFQIGNAIEATSVGQVLSSDNQWFYLNQGFYMVFLGAVGANPDIALGYPDGVYMKVNSVG